MTLTPFISTSLKYHLKLFSAKFLLPVISLKWTLSNYLLPTLWLYLLLWLWPPGQLITRFYGYMGCVCRAIERRCMLNHNYFFNFIFCGKFIFKFNAVNIIFRISIQLFNTYHYIYCVIRRTEIPPRCRQKKNRWNDCYADGLRTKLTLYYSVQPWRVLALCNICVAFGLLHCTAPLGVIGTCCYIAPHLWVW